MDKIKDIFIASIMPYFLEKENSWFEENKETILHSIKTQSFWQENTILLNQSENPGISQILKKIDELGYEKVFKVKDIGEFSQIGGVIEIFPINLNFAIRLDFLGNKIEAIEKLPIEIKNEKSEKNILIKRLKSQKIFSDIKGLKPGDYLVHLDHGIARYTDKIKVVSTPDASPSVDNKKTKNENQAEEYYVLEYAQGDKLYVPIGLERKLSRYVGFVEPKLNRLGGILWQRTKYKIKEEAEKFAKEILEMFAKKEMATRQPYHQKEFYEKLESTFSHDLTPDQKQCISEIENDFAKEKPADRIVCGDVGFGKTEVALRAAAMVAENGKQTVLMCPTTILAIQHYNTFQKRLNGLPFKVALLSRLQSQKEKAEIIKGIKQGDIDILIATHSVLSKKIEFSQPCHPPAGGAGGGLGLLIIDDEQRFGVKQKEKLRTQNPSIDILYLSATPIPRTLYLALSSLKEISFIQTPPHGRKYVKTYVLPFKKDIIKNAIEKELNRGGQIYFLHNRVETINTFKLFIDSLKTNAKIGILHAKLPEKEIVKVLNDFQNNKINLLLSTTIIENGLDISNANTLIVDNATRLGLAQAYQLRGRVGRSTEQASAYFLYPKNQLKGLAKKRLKALKEAEELGSGYKIALQDMEIRGAGNILGREQSGSVNKIGLNLYCQMLSEAVEKLKTNSS